MAQETSGLRTEFVLDVVTNTFQRWYGPPESRVLVLTNIKTPDGMSTQDAVFSADKYTDQVTWHDAKTGKLLAGSDFFEPLTENSLVAPGCGGRVYYPSTIGKGFYGLQAMPKSVGG